MSPRHFLYSSRFPSERLPPVHAEDSYVIGIDEAGRGPVLGPLVYALFLCPTSRLSWLKENGANDSKLLDGRVREQFFTALLKDDKENTLDQELPQQQMGWIAKAIHPEYISNCMLNQKHPINLNELSYAAVYELIGKVLDAGYPIKEAYVDTLGKADKYEGRLTSRFPHIQFTVRSKADSLFPIVGAASIVAKVLRDCILQEEEAIEASGYPGDAATITWLHENLDAVFGFPAMVRFSWSTASLILSQACHSVDWYDGNGGTNKSNPIKKDHQRNNENRRKKPSRETTIDSPSVQRWPWGLYNYSGACA